MGHDISDLRKSSGQNWRFSPDSEWLFSPGSNIIVNFRCCGYHYYGGYMDYIKGLPLAPHRCRSAPHQLPLATAVCIPKLGNPWA